MFPCDELDSCLKDPCALQPSLTLCRPLDLTFSQQQGLFQGVFSSHEMAKVLKPQLQDLSFQTALRVEERI